jgi:hypothetical protein
VTERSPRAPWTRALRTLAWGALFVAVISGRVLWSARSEWQSAQAALAKHDTAAAVMHLRRTASWHVPLSPYTPRALTALKELGQRLETARGAGAARMTERAARAAKSAARSPWLSPDRADPDPAMTFLALCGWFVWVGSALALVTRGMDAEGRPTAGALRFLVALSLGFGVFVLGLALA